MCKPTQPICRGILVMSALLVLPLSVWAAPKKPGPAKKRPPARKPVRKPAAPKAPSPGKPGPVLSKFLAGPMKDAPEIVFAARPAGRDHWYVNFAAFRLIKQRTKSEALWLT